MELVNQRSCARGCTLMLPQHFMCILDESLACLGVAQKNLSENFLFTAMGATSKEHRMLRTGRRRRVLQGRSYSVPGSLSIIKFSRIVLDAACYANSISRNTERRPAAGIFPFRYAN